MTLSAKVLDKLDVFQKNHKVCTIGEKEDILGLLTEGRPKLLYISK